MVEYLVFPLTSGFTWRDPEVFLRNEGNSGLECAGIPEVDLVICMEHPRSRLAWACWPHNVRHG